MNMKKKIDNYGRVGSEHRIEHIGPVQGWKKARLHTSPSWTHE